MSSTVVVDQQQIAFERTNTWNAIVRHCKIGKVRKKVHPFVTRLALNSDVGLLHRLMAGTGE